MEKQISKFKMKFKNGEMAILYKNYKFELWTKKPEYDAWVLLKNGYRFIIAIDKKTNKLSLSYSLNNYDKDNFKPKVHHVNDSISHMDEALKLFEDTLSKLSTVN